MGKSTGGYLVMRASVARALPSLVVAAAVLVVPCRALGGGVVPDAPQAESPPVAKNRFISFVPGNAGSQVALRVTFGSMRYLDRAGQVRWVGPPGDYEDVCGTGSTFRGAALECTPFYMDWGSEGLLHVTSVVDEDNTRTLEILPGSVYAVQAIYLGDDVEDETNYSQPLIVFTTSVYTDLVGWWTGKEWTAPDGLVTFHDVAAAWAKYGSSETIALVGVKTVCSIPPLFCGVGLATASEPVAGFENPDLDPVSHCTTPDPCGQSPRFTCGNAILEPAEQCDDGNITPGDGCGERCLFEPACGNGALDAPEQCDDGGTTPGDGCDGQCRLESECGNGRLEPDEQCDDGNTVPADGCDGACRSEAATAVVSLVPVDSNGPHAIVGDEIVLPSSSQRVFLELRLSNWDPGLTGAPGVRNYQAQIDATGFASGRSGSMAPPTEVVCNYNGPEMCLGGGDEGTSCDTIFDCETRTCNSVFCTAELGAGSRCVPADVSGEGVCERAYVAEYRIDVIDDTGGWYRLDTSSPGFRFGHTRLIHDGVLDDGSEKYLGTLVLDASSDATGTFTIGLKDGYAETFLLDDDNLAIPIAEIRPALITINTGCCLGNGTCTAGSLDCETNGGISVAACAGDCNGNGDDDACEILSGASDDCNGNGVPDECEPDCNVNGVADACDIAGGASDDCDGDGVPDECQSGDCQPNGIADHCDLADGTSEDCNFDEIPDECQPDEDCNTNGTKDICDIGSGTSFDCNLNLTPDECDLTGGSFDDNGNGIPDECEEAPGPDPLPYPNTRALSIAPSSQHAITALRVRLVKMYNTDETDPDNSICGPRNASLPDLSAADGQIRWAGPPQAYADEATPPMADFVASELQCCPHFRDWSPAALAAEFPPAATDLLHLIGREIVPCSEYEVQAVSINCLDLADENCYSDVLTVRTPRFGDVWEPFSPGSVGQPNFSDINAEVQKYKGFAYDPDAYSGAPPKYRAMLHGNVPDLRGLVGFLDIAQCVNGFKGLAYPEQGPVDCAPCP